MARAMPGAARALRKTIASRVMELEEEGGAPGVEGDGPPHDGVLAAAAAAAAGAAARVLIVAGGHAATAQRAWRAYAARARVAGAARGAAAAAALAAAATAMTADAVGAAADRALAEFDAACARGPAAVAAAAATLGCARPHEVWARRRRLLHARRTLRWRGAVAGARHDCGGCGGAARGA